MTAVHTTSERYIIPSFESLTFSVAEAEHGPHIQEPEEVLGGCRCLPALHAGEEGAGKTISIGYYMSIMYIIFRFQLVLG